jgi:uncharacterized membrane protein
MFHLPNQHSQENIIKKELEEKIMANDNWLVHNAFGAIVGGLFGALPLIVQGLAKISIALPDNIISWCATIPLIPVTWVFMKFGYSATDTMGVWLIQIITIIIFVLVGAFINSVLHHHQHKRN